MKYADAYTATQYTSKLKDAYAQAKLENEVEGEDNISLEEAAKEIGQSYLDADDHNAWWGSDRHERIGAHETRNVQNFRQALIKLQEQVLPGYECELQVWEPGSIIINIVKIRTATTA